MAKQKRYEILTTSLLLRLTEEIKNNVRQESDRMGMSMQDWLLEAIEFRIANPPENTPTPTEAIDIDAKFEKVNDRLQALEHEVQQLKSIVNPEVLHTHIEVNWQDFISFD
jgi:hypothetical protein